MATHRLLAAAFAVCLLGVAAAADDASTPSLDLPAKPDAATTKTRGPRGPMPAFTPEREAAAVTFVSAHHPELAPLLAHLKISRPNEYQKAIRKLFGDSERLAQSREAQPRRYELELQEWKLESRGQLLVARLTMGRTPELEAQLRNVLTEQMEVQRELLLLDRERLAQRLTEVDKALQRLDENAAVRLEERLQKALNSIGQRKTAGRADDKSSGDQSNGDDKANDKTNKKSANAPQSDSQNDGK